MLKDNNERNQAKSIILHDSIHTKYESMHTQSLLLEISAVVAPRASGIGKGNKSFGILKCFDS